ncbi:MAG: FtsX-like permease family protein [Streptosporangiaceae bacterium]
MRAGPVLQAAWAGAARKLVQSLVVFAVLAVSSAAALTGLTLVFAANAGSSAAIAATHGADLAVTINASKVTAAQLAAIRHLPGVTQGAGPYPETTITVAAGPAAAGGRGGVPPTQLTVVGRASPSGPLDDIIANPSIMAGEGHGRWPARPGEISLAVSTIIRLPVGGKLTVTSAPGRPSLTVTGYGDQALNYGDAWVVPSEVAALRAAGAPAQEQMLYTFTNAGTPAQISADLAELKAALPRGAVASSSSLSSPPARLTPGTTPGKNTVTKSQSSPPAGITPVRAPGSRNTGPSSPSLPATGATAGGTGAWSNANTPFVLAFAILGLVLAVLIVANVVSAAVIASYRRIGVLKSIGFTPAQVTATYLTQISIPAMAGAVAGTILGNWWVLPVISLYEIQGARVSVPLWINLTAPLGMLALTGLAAAVPAVRAGRLPAVAAITAGQAPRAGRGALAYRLAGRLRLPEPVTTGLAAPFSRPARSAVTLAALLFGITGVVLGASLNTSIHKINHSAFQGRGQLQVDGQGGKSATLTPGQAAAVGAAIHAQPGTLDYAAETDLLYSGGVGSGHGNIIEEPGYSSPVTVAVADRPGLPLMTYAYDGDSSGLGWSLLSGHWYNGPGQVVISTNLAGGTGLTTGDSITLTVNHKPVTVRIAGVVFLPNQIPTVIASRQTLGPQAAALTANDYDITLKPGTSIQDYTDTLQRAMGPNYGVGSGGALTFAGQLDTSLFAWLTVLVGVLAGLGVLNAALMATRERVHDLGVFKAVGMTPQQTITMVICWVIAPAIIAAAVALPAGLTTQDYLIGQLAAGNVLPGSFVHVLGGTGLLLLALGGLAIAVAGALGPAIWAARTRTSAVLHTE